MACAKPPKPESITPPSPLRHPVLQPVRAALKDTETLIRSRPPGTKVDDAIGRAERLLQRAHGAGVAAADLKRLDNDLQRLKDLAQNRMGDQVVGPAQPRHTGVKGPSAVWVLKEFSKDSAQRNAPRVINALDNKDHWQSKEYKEHLIHMIQGNARIPQEYKDQLPHDVAKILRICPNAAGIVKAMTLRGQRTPLASLGKLGSNANSAIGSAYELMGTAALIGKISTPVNGGPKLSINPAWDTVTFGSKSNINRQMNKLGFTEMPSRRTIESDVRIGHQTMLGGYREIGIDFKHASEGRPRYASDDLKNQVDNVVRAIQHGELDEYHFVTNTTFGTSFREVINSANEELGHHMIGCHEYVTSLPPSLI